MNRYQWKPGARIGSGISADLVGGICEKMDAEGRLTAANLVEDSRPEDAPLHNQFTWDNNAAADKWRRQEAMQIINSVEIVVPECKPVQAFIKVSNVEREYRPIISVVNTVSGRQALLSDAIRELERVQRKYSALKELAEIFSKVDQLKLNLDSKEVPHGSL